MAILHIPPDVREGIAAFRNLSEDDFNTFLLELERSPDAVSVPNIGPENSQRITEAVMSMSAVREYADVSVEQFMADVRESLRELHLLKPEEEPRFSDRLTRVLSSDVLKIRSKAVALSNEHEHVFCTARIVTDVRPVFGEDVKAPPDALTITHILKIEYHAAGNRIHELYLGLGSSDIKELRELLDRADDKAKSIRTMLESTKLPFIDPQE